MVSEHKRERIRQVVGDIVEQLASGNIAIFAQLLGLSTNTVQLEQAACRAENPPPSLQEVGQRLGDQPTTLCKINRTACHAIAESHTAYRQHLREKRLQGYREEIRQIVLQLQTEHARSAYAKAYWWVSRAACHLTRPKST